MKQIGKVMNENIDEVAKEFAAGQTLDDLRMKFSRAQQSSAFVYVRSEESALKEAEYWNTVYSKAPRQVQHTIPAIQQEMDYDVARKIFKEMIKDRAVQIGAVRKCDYKILLTKDYQVQ